MDENNFWDNIFSGITVLGGGSSLAGRVINSISNIPSQGKTFSNMQTSSNPYGLRSADAIDAWNRRANATTNSNTTPSNTTLDDALSDAQAEALKNRQAASNVIKMVLRNYSGFSESEINKLGNEAWTLSGEGYDSAGILEMLKGTAEFRKRFAGNEMLAKAGKPTLDIGTYIATERAFSEVLSAYEEILPNSLKLRDSKGNLRSPDEFIASWIGGEVSVKEIEDRLTIASDYSKSVDPNLKTALKNFYGIGEAEIAQYALGTKEDKDTFIRQYQTTKIGSEAYGANLAIDKGLAEQIVAKDINIGQVSEVFGNVAANKETFGMLGSIEGASLTEQDLIKANLNMDTEAAKKVKTLQEKEAARFSGSGAGTNILGTNISGQI